MVEQRAKSRAPVSCAKPVQKSSTKVASIKPETGVLLAQDPPAAKPHWSKKTVTEAGTKNRSILKGIKSRRTQQGKEKEPVIFDS